MSKFKEFLRCIKYLNLSTNSSLGVGVDLKDVKDAEDVKEGFFFEKNFFLLNLTIKNQVLRSWTIFRMLECLVENSFGLDVSIPVI